MYRSILAALDGSPRAALVLRHAVGLAERFGATLHLCRAVNIPLGLPPDAWTLTGDELSAALVDRAAKDLADEAAAIPEELRGQLFCRLGKPAKVIEDAADACHADLIVIGSHGYDAIDKLLGTTAARVVNHATRPVLVVR
ncbi:MAG TPA: universal stress protein [Nannocystaceae bacterium]|nr:universal stress protein [Nannocystaceae bacterium]